MYIFAEPMTEDQVMEIQNRNNAKIDDFERRILGLTGGDDGESREPQKDGWADIQANVEEAMEEDELSLDDASEDQEPGGEDAEDTARDLAQSRLVEEGPLYAKRDMAKADGAEASATVGDDQDDIEDEVDEADSEEGQTEVEEEEQDVEEEDEDEFDREEDAKEDETKEGEDQSEEDEARETDSNEIEETDSENYTEELSDKESEQQDQDLAAATDDTPENTSIEAEGNEDHNAESSEQGMLDSSTEKETESSPKHDAKPSSRRKLTSDPRDEEQDFITHADTPFLDNIEQEHAEAASITSDILAMTLTLRNKVNGQFVLRPENLTGKDKWSIEYSLVEVSTQSRAKTLYQACQLRRAKRLEKPEPTDEDTVVNEYVEQLRKMSQEGRKWRRILDEKDTEKPKQVLGKDLTKPHGEGGPEDQELEA